LPLGFLAVKPDEDEEGNVEDMSSLDAVTSPQTVRELIQETEYLKI